jgi:hypothetical protein
MNSCGATAKSSSKSNGKARFVAADVSLRIQHETLLVPMVLVRKGLFCASVRVGFSTS